MRVFRGYWQDFSDPLPSVVTVGSFDGVHRGHSAIFEHIKNYAEKRLIQSCVITFDPHPQTYFSNSDLSLLSTIDEKLELLNEAGIDQTIILNIDQKLSGLSSYDFTRHFLKARVGMEHMVLGFDHTFGKDRAGDRESLISMSKTIKFGLEVINPVQINQTIVCSSLIRNLLSEGKVYEAGDLLGRYYRLNGVVVHGFGRGKRLNYPTANLGNIASEKLIPRDGIYAGLAVLESVAYPAAISIGYNPTFTEKKHSIEAHLLNFDRDIYDQNIEIQFIERLRNEQKFISEAELIAQIGKDTRQCADILRLRGLMKEDYFPFKNLQ